MSIKSPVTLTPTQETILAKIAEAVRIVMAAPIRDIETIQAVMESEARFSRPRGLSQEEGLGVRLVLEALEDVDSEEPEEESMWEAQTNALNRRNR